MKHLDGKRLHHAFSCGMAEVLKRRQHLDEINVFPVADGDTGTNLAMTLEAMMDGSARDDDISIVGTHLANAALEGSRGNSGIIFAQFVAGLSRGLTHKATATLSDFVHAAEHGVDTAYCALGRPVEGTILTVMRAWSEAMQRLPLAHLSFSELLHHALKAARKALAETPEKLKVLAEAHVVDAGAEGFVHFVRGMTESLHEHLPGATDREIKPRQLHDDSSPSHGMAPPDQRFCVEMLLETMDDGPGAIRAAVAELGTSVIVADAATQVKVHLHTNRPDAVAAALLPLGRLKDQKVDDMAMQYAAWHHPLSDIAVVTDTACDLPDVMMQQLQIHQVPLSIQWGEHAFLDKRTLTPARFYAMQREKQTSPKSSQPAVKRFVSLYKNLALSHKSVVSIHLSSALSGTVAAARLAAETVKEIPVHVLDGRHLSTSLGLMVHTVAEAVATGASLPAVLALAERMPIRTDILVAVKTLKYMIRGGRVSPLKGSLARALHLHPIVSLDAQGRSMLLDKAIGFKGNLRKIIQRIQRRARIDHVEKWAVGHAGNPGDAKALADELEHILGLPPAYLIDISPIIGAHAGVGAVSVSVLWEAGPCI